VAALTVALVVPEAGAAEQWFLFGRHGGCFDIDTLKRRLPDLPRVSDPEAFVRYVQSKGLRFTRQAHPVPKGKAVEVVVPDRELSLVFVTAEHCRASEAEQK
jgi:hypothetical protein